MSRPPLTPGQVLDRIARTSSRVLVALLLAIPLTAGLLVFVDSCGSIHGSPRCGPASAPAVAILVLSLVLGSTVLRLPPNQLTERIVLYGVAYAIAFGFCLLVLWSFSRGRGH